MTVYILYTLSRPARGHLVNQMEGDDRAHARSSSARAPLASTCPRQAQRAVAYGIRRLDLCGPAPAGVMTGKGLPVLLRVFDWHG